MVTKNLLCRVAYSMRTLNSVLLMTVSIIQTVKAVSNATNIIKFHKDAGSICAVMSDLVILADICVA